VRSAGPAVWMVSAAIFFLPAVVVRVLAAGGSSSPTSEMLQTGVRLLALPFNGN